MFEYGGLMGATHEFRKASTQAPCGAQVSAGWHKGAQRQATTGLAQAYDARLPKVQIQRMLEA